MALFFHSFYLKRETKTEERERVVVVVAGKLAVAGGLTLSLKQTPQQPFDNCCAALQV